MLRIRVRTQRSEKAAERDADEGVDQREGGGKPAELRVAQPHSLRIGSETAASICRSKKFMVLMPNNTHSANRACLFCWSPMILIRVNPVFHF